jgi:hypothetical protein
VGWIRRRRPRCVQAGAHGPGLLRGVASRVWLLKRHWPMQWLQCSGQYSHQLVARLFAWRHHIPFWLCTRALNP